MDLQNYNIKLGDLLKNAKARVLLEHEFSEWIHLPMIRLAHKLPLSEILRIAHKHVPAEKIQNVLKKLEQI